MPFLEGHSKTHLDLLILHMPAPRRWWATCHLLPLQAIHRNAKTESEVYLDTVRDPLEQFAGDS